MTKTNKKYETVLFIIEISNKLTLFKNIFQTLTFFIRKKKYTNDNLRWKDV